MAQSLAVIIPKALIAAPKKKTLREKRVVVLRHFPQALLVLFPFEVNRTVLEQYGQLRGQRGIQPLESRRARRLVVARIGEYLMHETEIRILQPAKTDILVRVLAQE